MPIRHAVHEFSWVAGPKVLGGGLQFAFSLLLMRYFGLAEYGAISVCVAGILLSDSIIGGATDSGVLRLAPLFNISEPKRSLQYQQAGLILKLVIAVVLLLPVIAVSRPISDLFLQSRDGTSLVMLAALGLVGMLSVRSAQMHFQVNRQFTSYGMSDLLNSLLKFGGLWLLLMFARQSPIKVLGIYSLAPLLVTAVLLMLFARPMVLVPFSFSAFKELAHTVKWYLATAAMGTIIARMDIFLVSAFAGISEAGIFSAAQAISLVPQLIGSYIAVVFSPRIMPMFEAGTLKSLYRRFQSAIAALTVVILALAWFFVHGLALKIFPASFLRAEDAIMVLLPAGLSALINFPLTILLLLFLRPKLLLMVDCVLLPFLAVAYIWAIPRYGANGAAAVTSAAALLKTAIMQITAWRLLSKTSLPHSQVPAPQVLQEEFADVQG